MKNGMMRNRRLQLCGWVLFLLCGLLFIAESVRTYSMLLIFGSLLFLVGCILCMIPLLESMFQHRD